MSRSTDSRKKSIVKLYEQDREFYQEHRDGEDPTILGTVKGYKRLAHAAGVKILTPPKLSHGGGEVSNPFVVREGGHLVEIMSRKIAFGYDHHGEPTAVDQIILFNPMNHLAKKLLEIAKKYPAIAIIKNRASIQAAKLKQGMFISLADTGITDVGVWVEDIGHPELTEIWTEYHNSVLYAERNAQTICERSAIRKHPGIPEFSDSMLSDDGLFLSVPLYAWSVNELESKEMTEIASKIELGKTVDIKRTVSFSDSSEKE